MVNRGITLGEGRKGGGEGQHSFAPQAPMTPISRVNRDIFHDIARRKGARARAGSVTLSHPLCSPASPPGSFLSGTAAHHSADPSEVDEKFSRVVIPGVIAPHADDESKIPYKCDINAIALRAADRRPDFAYLLSRASFEFIGHHFANCRGNPPTLRKFLCTCPRMAHY